jgi:hypothetical protein
MKTVFRIRIKPLNAKLLEVRVSDRLRRQLSLDSKADALNNETSGAIESQDHTTDGAMLAPR